LEKEDLAPKDFITKTVNPFRSQVIYIFYALVPIFIGAILGERMWSCDEFLDRIRGGAPRPAP